MLRKSSDMIRVPRFVVLPDPALTFREEGLVVQKANASGLRVVYLSRQVHVGEEVMLAVEKVRNKRRTFGIAFGATTCSKRQIRQPPHSTTCCRPLSCPLKGKSVVSYIGLPFQEKKQTFTSVHSAISLIRQSDGLTVVVDGTKVTCSDPDGILSADKALQFIVLTDDVKSITLSESRLPALPASAPPLPSEPQQVSSKQQVKSKIKAQAPVTTGPVNKGPQMDPISKASKKKGKSKSIVKEETPPPAPVPATPDPPHDNEVELDLVHPKWGKTQPDKKAKSKTQTKPVKTAAVSEKAVSQSAKGATCGKEAKSVKTTSSQPFAFLIAPYPNDNVSISDQNQQVTRVNEEGSNIVYFNRCLSGDTLSLRLESFSKPEAMNMTFGITTCNVKSISAHKFHVKSFCTNDGRPCGGRSLVCQLDRKVRGAGIISFKKVPEGINFLSDGFLVSQFKDKDSIFKHKPAFPFIALTGDVESVRIVDPAEAAAAASRMSAVRKRSRNESMLSTLSTLDSGTESPLIVMENKASVPLIPSPSIGLTMPKAVRESVVAPATGDRKGSEDSDSFEEIQSKKKKKSNVLNDRRFAFVKTPYMDDNIEIKEKNRLVVRKAYNADHFNAVYFSRELSTDRRLAIQVERLGSNVPTSNCFNIGISTCDPETVKRFDCHAHKTCWVKSECGGLSTSFSILKCKTNSQPGTIVTMERRGSSVLVGAGDWFRTQLTDNMTLFADRDVYPFIVLNGSVSSIKIIEDPERFSAPLPAVPRPLIPVGNDEAAAAPITAPAHFFSQFLVPPYASSNMLLTNKKRNVTRVAFKGPRIVMLNHPLEIGDKFVMRIEQSEVIHISSCAFMLGLTTCNLSSMDKIVKHGPFQCGDGHCGGQSLMRTITSFAETGAEVLVERKAVVINITMVRGSEMREMFIDMGKVPNVRYFYPFLLLSGNVTCIRLLDQRYSLVMPVPAESPAEPLPLPADPSPSFERDPRRDLLPAFVTRVPHGLGLGHAMESPLLSPTPPDTTASASPFLTEPKLNYPGVNGYSDSLASYDFENYKDRNTPTDWDQSSNYTVSPIPSPIPTSFAEPIPMRRLPPPGLGNPIHQRGQVTRPLPEQVIQNGAHLTPSLTPSPVLRVNANRTASLFIPRKWYSNANVRFSDSRITRLRSPGARNYIFSSEMRVNEKITFRVSGVDDHLSDGSLVFGLTTTPILKIDFSSLPPDARQLKQHPDHSVRWFTTHNLYNTVGICDGLTVVRKENGIFLFLDSEEEEVGVIPNISSSSVVYPFFLMSGCVRSLDLDTSVGPLSFPDQVRLYLIFFYLTMLNRFALHKY